MLSNDVQAFRKRWSARIAADALAKRVIATLWRQRAQHVAPILDQARAQNPVIDPVIRGEPELMAQHVDDHFRALLTLPSASGRDRAAANLDFVVAHGVRRAQGGVPLRAVLQAYRSGHKSYWAIMCAVIDELAESAQAGMRATMLLSDYCIEYTDLISMVVTDAYVAEEARLANERTRLGMAVMECLLNGEWPVQDAGRALCERHHIDDGCHMAVVIARSVHPAGNGADRSRAELAAEIGRTLAALGCGALVEPRQTEVLAVVGDTRPVGARVAAALRRSGVTALYAPASATRVGIGLDVQAVAELPRSYAEAVRAIELLGGRQPVAHLAELDVNAYLRHAADATARRLLPWLPEEVWQPPLADTLRAFAACNLNVKACARRLRVHTNTIYHRLNRIQHLTGQDPRAFAALGTLMTALELGAVSQSEPTLARTGQEPPPSA